MADRSVEILDLHGRPQTDLEIKNSIMLFANALSGVNASGVWSHDGSKGFYKATGNSWNAKIVIDSLANTTIIFPLKASKCILVVYEISGASILSTNQYYIDSGSSLLLSNSFLGKKILVVINQSDLVGR